MHNQRRNNKTLACCTSFILFTDYEIFLKNEIKTHIPREGIKEKVSKAKWILLLRSYQDVLEANQRTLENNKCSAQYFAHTSLGIENARTVKKRGETCEVIEDRPFNHKELFTKNVSILEEG